MKDEPEIVKLLKKEEKQGFFKKKSKHGLHNKFVDGPLVNSEPKKDSSDGSREFEYAKNLPFNYKNKELYRILVENLLEGILILDFHGKILFANPAMIKMVGLQSVREGLGRNVLDFVDPQDHERVNRDQFLVSLGKGGFLDTYRVITADGRKIWVEGIGTTIEYNGRTANLVFLREVTDRKKKEEKLDFERRQLLSIFDSIDEAIYVVDPKSYKILYANSFLEKTFGENLVGQQCYKVLQGRDSPCEVCRNKKNSYDEKTSNKWEYHNPLTGRDYDIKGRIIKWPDGRDVRFELAIDITKCKMALNELNDAHEILYTLNKNLEQKVKERTSKIEQLMEQKNEFINQLGHDLKTPLTPVVGLLPLLQERIDDSKSKELMDIIIRNVYFMKDLVTKTIDLAKLNSTDVQLSIEELALFPEVDTALKNSRVILQENNIKTDNRINRNILVKADRIRLDELLNNLITNAVKYTEYGDKIIIDAEENNGVVTVSITDTGIGMTKEQLSHIFDEFYKADPSRHKLDSSGLGLAICKRIVEKHGGRIWAESPGPGKGSMFYFTLQTI
jgi:PAS domain S-box-containing protein